MSDTTTSSTATTTTSRADRRDPRLEQLSPASRFALPVSGLVLLALAVFAAVWLVGENAYLTIHRDYPGLPTSLAANTLRAVLDTSSWLAMGVLSALIFLSPGVGKEKLRVFDSFELRVLKTSALVWLLSCFASIGVFAADSSGMPFGMIFEPGGLSFLISADDLPKAWIISTIAAAGILAGSYFARTWKGLLLPYWMGMFGVVAPIIVGQVLVGRNHDYSVDAAAFQTAASVILFGVLLVWGLRTASGRLIPLSSLKRFFTIAWPALAVIVVAEMIITWVKLSSGDWSLLGTPTGVLSLSKLALYGLIGLCLFTAQRKLSAGTLSRGWLRNLSGISALAVIALLGVSLVMTRIPPPHYFDDMNIAHVLLGFDLQEAPDWIGLFFVWRPNVIFLALGVTAIVLYLRGVRILKKRGDRWPVNRTVAWVAGWLVAIFLTCSGYGKYSAASFSIHMIVHMGLNMVVPILLVLGGVITLTLRASKPTKAGEPAGLHDWLTQALNWPVLRFIYNPLLVFLTFVGSYYMLYLTDLFGEAMRFHWAHQFMNLHFMIIGYLFYSLVIGVDRPPRPLPPLGKLGFVLAAMPFHAFFGVVLMTTETTIAENFYRYLNFPWMGDLMETQYVGGGVAWAGGEIPLLLVVIVLVTQWSKQDHKEAKRKDRHDDRGLDDEYEAYNKMLEQLASRGKKQPAAASAGIPSNGEGSTEPAQHPENKTD